MIQALIQVVMEKNRFQTQRQTHARLVGIRLEQRAFVTISDSIVTPRGREWGLDRPPISSGLPSGDPVHPLASLCTFMDNGWLGWQIWVHGMTFAFNPGTWHGNRGANWKSPTYFLLRSRSHFIPPLLFFWRKYGKVRTLLSSDFTQQTQSLFSLVCVSGLWTSASVQSWTAFVVINLVPLAKRQRAVLNKRDKRQKPCRNHIWTPFGT